MVKVKQYDLKTGELLNEYNSIIQAAKAVGIQQGLKGSETNIRRVINREGQSAYGYAWKTDRTYEYAKVRESKAKDKKAILKPSATNRVLVIGDLHEPFTRDGYMEFCFSIYEKYNCNKVVFLGDIIDNHYSSFHSTDPDGHSAAKELAEAKTRIKMWHSVFPNAIVLLGNHDLIPQRQMFNAGVSSSWIKPIGEVLDTPTWTFMEETTIDGVQYIHGISRKARKRMYKDLTSVVQGHYHTESYIEHSVGANYKLFAMQVGCGMHDKSYAAAYGKHFDKMHINCGVVLENGTLPILEYMKL